MENFLSRPCSGVAVDGTSNDELKFQILFSEDWPTELQTLMKNLQLEEWHAMSHTGKEYRFASNGELSEIPEPHDFPLLLQPISAEQLQAELDLMLLEADLAVEQLRLEELEYEQQQELDALDEATKSHLNSTVAASSAKAPSSCHLATYSLYATCDPLS